MLALFPYLKEASITPYLSKDQIAAAREMDLLTYLRRFEPEELVHIGGDTYATRTHDSLKISNGKWCWWSRSIGGTNALDYLTKVEGLSFLEAAQRILGGSPYVLHKSEPTAPLPCCAGAILSGQPQLSGIGTNINQIAKVANASGYVRKEDIQSIMEMQAALWRAVKRG